MLKNADKTIRTVGRKTRRLRVCTKGEMSLMQSMAVGLAMVGATLFGADRWQNATTEAASRNSHTVSEQSATSNQQAWEPMGYRSNK